MLSLTPETSHILLILYLQKIFHLTVPKGSLNLEVDWTCDLGLVYVIALSFSLGQNVIHRFLLSAFL